MAIFGYASWFGFFLLCWVFPIVLMTAVVMAPLHTPWVSCLGCSFIRSTSFPLGDDAF
ncbi:MAG: hypothetical protein CM15mP103_08770 [Gammaproteobacteria bacterium]|nr:MAG: hypothetical protein CM15mP103_08770 [Gammaproteobacteria bacterium]